MSFPHKVVPNFLAKSVVRFFSLRLELPEPELEPPFLAGAGAVFLVRLRLLLLLYCKYLFLRDPNFEYDYD